MPSAHRAAIVHLPHREPLARQNLVPPQSGPGVVDYLNPRAAVDHDYCWVPETVAITRGLGEAPVESHAVMSFDRDHLTRQNVILVGERCVGSAVDTADRTVRFHDDGPGRLITGAIVVQIIGAIRRERNRVCSGFAGQAALPAAVEANRIKLP